MKGNDGVRIPEYTAAQHIAQVTGNNAQHTTSVQICDSEGGNGELHATDKVSYMAYAFDVPSAIASTSLGKSECWKFIAEFAAAWLRPLVAEDGGTEQEIAAAADGLGLTLPPAVIEAYLLLGSCDDLTRIQDRLLEPQELFVDEAGDVLVFRTENQHVAQWGIPLGALSLDDPPVVFRSFASSSEGTAWMPYIDRFSLACVEMALSESMMHSDFTDNRELDIASVSLLEARFQRGLFPDYPMWADPGGQPVRWFADDDVLLRDDGAAWLWTHARTADALDRVRAVLPGQWLMSGG